ncbi:MAG: amidohydrolase family protein [Myxococcota bacterium]
MHDIVIRGGMIVDGSGRLAYRGDVAIDGARVSAVGKVSAEAWRTIDAEGRLVTPGFIDPHTHLDAQLVWDPLATPACWHGITTVVLGNCGVSYAPVRPTDRERLSRTLESVEEIPVESIMASFTWSWEGYAGYLAALAARPLGVNAAGLVGHAPLRLYAMGEAGVDPHREPREVELARMQQALDDAVAAGALGFSTSRTRSHTTPEGVPIPGSFARGEERRALTDVLRKQGKGIVQWVAGFGEEDRSEEYPEARREVSRIAAASRSSGRPVIFSMFTHAWVPTLHRHVLDQAGRERAAGADVRPMQSPRAVLSLLGLANRSPLRGSAWKELYARPIDERRAALEDAELRRRLVAASGAAQESAGAELYLLGPEVCDYRLDPERQLSRVAARRGQRPAEVVVELFRESDGRQLFVHATSNQVEAHIDEVLGFPGALVGLGDNGAHVTSICDASLTTYLLCDWCRARNKLPLERAVAQLTSEPARAFGIGSRGLLAPGYFADVNVIDYDALAMELPEYAHDFPAHAGRWTQRARGYDYTLVNGEVTIERDRHTGRLPGVVLRA